MGRWTGNVIYIDRNPNNLNQGWGWVEGTTEDLKRFDIPHTYPMTRQVTKTQEVTVTRYEDSVPFQETYTNTYEDTVYPPFRGNRTQRNSS